MILRSRSAHPSLAISISDRAQTHFAKQGQHDSAKWLVAKVFKFILEVIHFCRCQVM